MNKKIIQGFSKFSKEKKIDWLIKNYLNRDYTQKKILLNYWNPDVLLQKLHDEFSENTITNFYFPFGIAPNFLIDGKIYAIPMVIEESSIVAAAANSAKFWLDKGGFKTTILSSTKLGHTHFIFNPGKDNFQILNEFFKLDLKSKLIKDTNEITKNMRKRGGGIMSIELINKTKEIPGYYQLKTSFDTKDSMGANFINSCMEQFGKTLSREIHESKKFTNSEKKSLQIVMNILSNYTPDCLVRAEVSCKIKYLTNNLGIEPYEFAEKFYRAIQIAEIEPYRATTHNKGIMNGIDALVIATGNDFRSVEACVHTYASRSGIYSALTHCSINKEIFKFWIELPLSIGVVGGLTSLHPLAKISLKILRNPNAKKLMSICAVIGLAQNFSAVYSLITTGIQKGHMKMHLFNILNQLQATKEEKYYFSVFFKHKTITRCAVVKEFNRIRNIKS